ncbi:MAG: HPr family phosphocarrier protein [Kiritimatiellia bacterium]|jgi:phosphotransferase system HPr (HPr) family protein
MPKISSRFIVPNAFGMHARPAALFAKTAVRYEASISVRNGGGFVDGKSIIELLAIGAVQGTPLTVVADGIDAAEAMQAIQCLFADAFGEE